MPLFLGYDASCGTCKNLAHKVQKEVGGDSLTVLPLGNARMSAWRSQAFSGDPPWRPTLIEVSDSGRVRGWVGPAMGWAIVTRLGIRMSVRLARLLGDLRVESSPRLGGAELARRPFVRLAAGAVGAVTLLGGGATTPAAASTRSSVTLDKDITETAEASQEEAAGTLRSYLGSSGEARELLEDAYSHGSASIHQAAQHDELMQKIDSLVQTADTLEVNKDASEVKSAVHQLEGGGTLRATSAVVGPLLVVVYETNDAGRDSVSVMVFEAADEQADTFRQLATSVDGERVIALSESSDDEDVTEAASGCNEAACNAKGACRTCQCTDLDKMCVLNLCGPCIAACNPWEPVQVCLLCAAVWCPIALTLNNCCKRKTCGWRPSCG